MFWFHVYLAYEYTGSYYAPDIVTAVRRSMIAWNKNTTSVALVTWKDENNTFQSRVLLECIICLDEKLRYKEEK